MTKANSVTDETTASDEPVVTGKKKLELVPNEVVGYRIRPDQWNWSVVVVKVHGKDSKNAGQQYESPLPAYCKDIKSAIEVIYDRVSKIEGRLEQDKAFDTTGVASDLESLKKAFVAGEKAALWAVKDLEDRLRESGFDIKTIGRLMQKGVENSESVEVEEAE